MPRTAGAAQHGAPGGLIDRAGRRPAAGRFSLPISGPATVTVVDRDHGCPKGDLAFRREVAPERARTPIVHGLIATSASPFRGPDRESAIDSTGLAPIVAGHKRWVSEAWGTVHADRQWLKGHARVSTPSTGGLR